MGKIQNMQQNQNNVNLSYVRNQSKKPKLKIDGIKGLATLIGPNSKRYRLSPNQRNFQLKARAGLTIASLLAAGLLVAGRSYTPNHQVQETKAIETSIDNEFEKEDVMQSAEEKLLNIIYQDDAEMELSYVDYMRTEDNIEKLVVKQKSTSPYIEADKVFQYLKSNDLLDKLILENNNSDIINEFLDMMIDVKNDKNVSQEDLAKLDALTSNIDSKDYKLDGKDIVELDRTAKKEQKGFEIEIKKDEETHLFLISIFLCFCIYTNVFANVIWKNIKNADSPSKYLIPYPYIIPAKNNPIDVEMTLTIYIKLLKRS